MPPYLYASVVTIHVAEISVTTMVAAIAQNSRRVSKRITSAILRPVAAEAMTKVRKSAVQGKFMPSAVSPLAPSVVGPSAVTINTGGATGDTP